MLTENYIEQRRSRAVPETFYGNPPATRDTAHKVSEHRIRYWDCRPMEPDPAAIVAPADAHLLVGALQQTSRLFRKHQLFEFEELFGKEKPIWRRVFRRGDYAVLSLTPDKYHYNHVPVAGMVWDVYEIAGVHQACNSAKTVAHDTPYSQNRRTVTIIDTDVVNGTQAGFVAPLRRALRCGECENPASSRVFASRASGC